MRRPARNECFLVIRKNGVGERGASAKLVEERNGRRNDENDGGRGGGKLTQSHIRKKKFFFFNTNTMDRIDGGG